MKQLLALIVIISVALLILPAIPLNMKNNTPGVDNLSASEVNSSSQTNSSVTQDNSSTDVSSSSSTTNSSSDTDKGNNSSSKTYKVYNHITKEVMELSPLDYIIGVVGAEMPAGFDKEAIKAQAVAAHTNTIRLMAAPKQDNLQGATISTDPATHQAYISKEDMKLAYGKNFDTYYNKIHDCVNSVITKMLVYEDEPIVAAFHAMSTGKTEDSKNVWGSPLPYLVPADSKLEEKLDTFYTTTTLADTQVKEILVKAFPTAKLPSNKKSWIKVTKRSKSDTVLTAKVGKLEVSGAQIRTAFELKSSSFTVEYKDKNFTFKNKGYGHGVGMSQNGANQLALNGKNYKQILSHYYKGTKLVNISK